MTSTQFAYSALFYVVRPPRGDAAGFEGHGIGVMVVKSAYAAPSTPVGLSSLLRPILTLTILFFKTIQVSYYYYPGGGGW